MQRCRFRALLLLVSVLITTASDALAAETIALTVDATKTPAKLLRSSSLTGLKFEGGGKVLPWVRDTLDVFTFHLDIPAGVSELNASFDFIEPEGNSATDKLMVLEWNAVVLYPAGTLATQQTYHAKIILPTIGQCSKINSSSRAGYGRRRQRSPTSDGTASPTPDALLRSSREGLP
jgi:hypothetical protein